MTHGRTKKVGFRRVWGIQQPTRSCGEQDSDASVGSKIISAQEGKRVGGFGGCNKLPAINADLSFFRILCAIFSSSTAFEIRIRDVTASRHPRYFLGCRNGGRVLVNIGCYCTIQPWSCAWWGSKSWEARGSFSFWTPQMMLLILQTIVVVHHLGHKKEKPLCISPSRSKPCPNCCLLTRRCSFRPRWAGRCWTGLSSNRKTWTMGAAAEAADGNKGWARAV